MGACVRDSVTVCHPWGLAFERRACLDLAGSPGRETFGWRQRMYCSPQSPMREGIPAARNRRQQAIFGGKCELREVLPPIPSEVPSVLTVGPIRSGHVRSTPVGDRLSLIHISEPTRLGMSSYAVFCLKKKKK